MQINVYTQNTDYSSSKVLFQLHETTALIVTELYSSYHSSDFALTNPFDVDSSSEILPRKIINEAFQTMLASEQVLRKDWDSPEEDEAWANL